MVVRNILERIRIGVEICCVSRFSGSLCSPFCNTTTKIRLEEMVEDLCEQWISNDRESEIFLLMYVSILRVISINELSSLKNISRVKLFQVLKQSSGHSRGILVVSCETWG